MAGAAKLDAATVAAAAPVAPFRNLRRCTLSRGLEIFEDVFLVICAPIFDPLVELIVGVQLL